MQINFEGWSIRAGVPHCLPQLDLYGGFGGDVSSYWSISSYKCLYYIRLWMDGPMAGVVPDVVEYEVGDFWRTFCKLEKGFVDVPPAKKLAEMVILVVILC